MAINSRKKGARGDKKAIGFLKEWTGYKFVRVPQSGGLRWKTSTNSRGDLICDEPNIIFPFCIEVKNYGKIDFSHPLYLDNADLLQFWRQCKRDAKKAKKFPLLLIRYDGLPKFFFFVIVNVNTIKEIFTSLYRYYMLAINEEEGIFIIPSTEFLNIKYTDIEQGLIGRLDNLSTKVTIKFKRK